MLLIACANVANLLLAGASARQKEVAVRLALGASRWRVVRQLLAESVLLSFLGAMLGVGLAVGGVSLIRSAGTASIPRLREVGLDWLVLAIALVLSVTTGILFGLVPALQASRPDLNDTLKEGGRGASTAGRTWVRNGLIVSEVAVALVLLVGAGLLLNSFVRLTNVRPGFDARGALTMQVSLPKAKYPDIQRRDAFFAQILERIEAIPGVTSAGVSMSLPLAEWLPNTLITIAGRRGGPEGGYPADFEFCTPGYFQALGIPLRRGRLLEPRDTASSRVIVINEALGREHFPNEDPLGQRIIDGKDTWEVVGVVGNVHSWGLAEPARPLFYMPLGAASWNSGNLTVRTTLPPRALTESVRKAILRIDSDQPVANVRRLEDVVAGSVAQRRLVFALLAGFAASALLLAAIGLYGVIAYSVSQRTREIGIRVALGAQRGHVLGLVLGQGATLAGVGIVLGVLGGLSVTHVLTSQLYNVKATDPTTFAGTSLVLLLVALLASWFPARRAASVDPMTSLK